MGKFFVLQLFCLKKLILTEAVFSSEMDTLEAAGHEWHYALLWCKPGK